MEKSPGTPFDKYPGPDPVDRPGKRKIRLQGLHGVLRVASAVTFWLAILSACAVLLLDSLHFTGLDVLPWRLKSAFPLIFAGISYACLQFTVPRSWKELVLSLAACAAFILWGSEQFVPNASLALLMDDIVVFLFVMDLGIVIRWYLK